MRNCGIASYECHACYPRDSEAQQADFVIRAAQRMLLSDNGCTVISHAPSHDHVLAGRQLETLLQVLAWLTWLTVRHKITSDK